MGGLAIAALIFDLFTTYGPQAKLMYDKWVATIPPGTEPTPEMWRELREKIDAHSPDTF